jgi:hypothetical protein
MRRTLGLGMVDYNHSGRKNCRVTVEVELNDGRLSICGNIWNPQETDCYSCGQNIYTLAELLHGSHKMQRIKAIWERWHLNDMKAGSPKQEEYLREHPVKAEYPQSHYEVASKMLADAGLNPDQTYLYKGLPYQYGFAWLKEELPAEVIAEVESWFTPTAAEPEIQTACV